MTKLIGLAKQAYSGPPKPTTTSILGKDDIEKSKPERHWSYKTRKVRKQEIVDSL